MANAYSALQALQERSDKLNRSLQKNPSAKRFFTKTNLIASDLRQKSARLLAGAGLTGALLMTPISTNHNPLVNQTAQVASLTVAEKLQQTLPSLVPHSPTKLDTEQATKIESAIKNATGLSAKAVLDGQELNHQVGYIGYEQHLRRYPGDTILDHDDEQIAGVAPGLGAWGYFAKSQSTFTTQDYEREKWYAVAQTLYLPNWSQDFTKLRDWYKYRKVLIVNPANGKAVVADIADAGPAQWTGKQFGASPEAMKALNLHIGSRKGLVLFLFLDDPNNQVPLGPVNSAYPLK